MIQDNNFKVISEKFLAAAQKQFYDNKIIEFDFTIYGVFDTEQRQFLVVAEINNEEENTFVFTLQQAKKFISNMAFSTQFTTDNVYRNFARLMIKSFSGTVTQIEKIDENDLME
ncbi:MAG: hypothetical protein ACJ8LM_16585 [Candidatus Udaeobacter sp.]